MASKYIAEKLVTTRSVFNNYIPLNRFYNLQPVNQGRIVFGTPLRRGRPPKAEKLLNSLLNSDVFSDQVQEVLKPFKLFEIISINCFIGTSAYRITPTNAWRTFFWGGNAIRMGRPSNNERIVNQTMRTFGVEDPGKTFAKLFIAMIGLSLTWVFKQASTPTTPTTPITTDPIEDDVITEQISSGAQQAIEASLCFHVRCDHDACDDESYFLKTEILDYVYYEIGNERLVWACSKTRAFQPCIVRECMPFEARFEVLFA